MDACVKKGLEHASIWGHSPHYITTLPNPKVSYALLSRLRNLVEIDVELEGLREAGEAFEGEVDQAISKQADVTAYVRRLEQRYDETHGMPGDMPSPDAMVQELEAFLKRQQPPSNLQNGS